MELLNRHPAISSTAIIMLSLLVGGLVAFIVPKTWNESLKSFFEKRLPTPRGICSILAREGLEAPEIFLDFLVFISNIFTVVFWKKRFPLSTDKEVENASWYLKKYLFEKWRGERDPQMLSYFVGIVARINRNAGRKDYLKLSFFGLQGEEIEKEYKKEYEASPWHTAPNAL